MPLSLLATARRTLFILPLLSLFLFPISGCGRGGDSSPQTTESSDPPKPLPEDQRVPDELKNVPALALSGNFRGALKILDSWITEHPEDPRGYTLRAGVYSQTRQRESAIADLNKAVELSPTDADLFHSRGLFYLMHGPLESARPDLERALELNPRHDDAANHLGLLKLSSGAFAESVKNFDAAISANPNNHSYYNNRGLAHWRAGSIELARADFDSALKLKPQDANALSNRGQLAMQQKQYEGALRDFTSAIKSDPYNLSHYNFRQTVCLKLGRLLEASHNAKRIVWLKELFRLQQEVHKHPENQELQVELGNHFARESDDVMALKVFEALLAHAPDNSQGRLGRAQIMMRKGEFQKVVDECTAVLRRESSYDAHSLRGDAWLKLGKYDEAIADFEASERFDSQVGEAYTLRAKQRAASGDHSGADADRTKAKAFSGKLQTADAEE